MEKYSNIAPQSLATRPVLTSRWLASGRGQRMHTLMFVFFTRMHPQPLARSSADLFQMYERSKCLQYEERIINIDHGSFCPLIFSTTGAAGPRCDRFLKRMAGMLADEDRSPYSCTLSWLRCRISFAKCCHVHSRIPVLTSSPCPLFA